MYTSTIEPRLIDLLNNEERPSPSNRIDLPPLQDPNVLKASCRPRTLEPNTHTSNHAEERSTVKSSAQNISQILSADSTSGSGIKNGPISKESADKERQSLSKILQGVDESPGQRSISKKRHRSDGDSHKDDFVQLPQPPPKKQRAPKQVVPPIIIGLFEPPPNAALFPPIASSAFHDSHGRNSLNVNVPTEKGKERESERRVLSESRNHATSHIQVNNPVFDAGRGQPNSKRKDKFPSRRKKWTEEETNQLLLGVHKYGIGKWKAILNDSLFKFNDRSPSDLKDRFRTICPAEIQTGSKEGQQKSGEPASSSEKARSNGGIPTEKPKSTSSLLLENILIEEESSSASKPLPNAEVQRNTSQKATHRRLLSDLESLGISGPSPFKKSSRKERRPFTEEEDNNIMKGYTLYGPQWAKIQADKDLGLKERRSTDIRDRFRNRWKSIYEGLPAGENMFASKTMGPGIKNDSKKASNGGNEPGGNENVSGARGGTNFNSGVIGKNNSIPAENSPASSLPSFPSTNVLGNSERPIVGRGNSSQNLAILSSNSISNSYPLPSINSHSHIISGKEIFYHLPNPNSKASSNTPNPLSLTSMTTEPLMASSGEPLSSFSDSQPNDMDDSLLAPFQADHSATAGGLGIEAPENGLGVEEIAANFNPSSIGEMDIQRFLLDDTWPLK